MAMATAPAMAAKAKAKASIPLFGKERPEPGRYFLDLHSVWNVSLQMNGEDSTFGEAIRKLKEANAVDEVNLRLNDDAFSTFEAEGIVTGERDNSNLLRILWRLVELQNRGVDVDHVSWFFYEQDSSSGGDKCHVFFLVQDGKIVDEHVAFFADEPLVLKKDENTDPIWRSHLHFDAASEFYWYRKFYTETMTGQLMVLRPDQPPLYHFDRTTGSKEGRNIEFLTVAKLYRLLWVAVALLAAIAIPPLRNYMLVVAAALFVDVLWRWWADRKVGSVALRQPL